MLLFRGIRLKGALSSGAVTRCGLLIEGAVHRFQISSTLWPKDERTALELALGLTLLVN